MAKKAELLEEAKRRNLDVNSKTTVAELEALLGDETTQAGGSESASTAERNNIDKVKVNDNENGEATNGTTKEGSEDTVTNTESVPQNGVEGVEVFESTDNEVAKKADEARTAEEVKFADESNPNQKSRVNSTQGEEFDQDGNVRTGGKSYGIADDDLTNFTFPEENKGKAPEEEQTEQFTGRVSAAPASPGSFLNTDTNAKEWSIEEQQAEEEVFKDEENGISARVLTSTGGYVRIKFFRNNLAFGTYRSHDYDRAEAEKFLSKLKEQAGL